MKKTLFILTIAALATSCNDDDGTPTTKNADALVTRISRSGVTVQELFYDVDKKLYRMNEYDLGKLISYTIYDYNQDGLKELRKFLADDHSVDYRMVFTVDNFQRIMKGEYYPNAGTDQVTSFLTFEYDGEGLLKNRKYTIYQSLSSQSEYTYDNQGNEITKITTYNPNEEGEFIIQIDYTPLNETILDRWKEYAFILDLTDSGEHLKNMFISNTRYRRWDALGSLRAETSTDFSGQEYDDDGNLTRQVITKKDITDPENPDIVDDMTYDFN